MSREASKILREAAEESRNKLEVVAMRLHAI